MKKVNLNFELIGLDAEKLGHAGENIATLLMSEMKGDSVKLFDWAMSFHKKEEVSLDESDFLKLRELISNTERMPVIVKAPIIKYLNSIK